MIIYVLSSPCDLFVRTRIYLYIYIKHVIEFCSPTYIYYAVMSDVVCLVITYTHGDKRTKLKRNRTENKLAS